MSGHRRGPPEVQIPEPSFWNSLQSYEKLNSVTCGLLSILEQQYGQTTQSSLGILFPLELIPVCYMIVRSLSSEMCIVWYGLSDPLLVIVPGCGESSIFYL